MDGRGQHERQRTSGIGGFWIGKTWYGYRSWTGTFIEAPPAPPMQDTRAETQLLPGDAGLPEEHGLSANRQLRSKWTRTQEETTAGCNTTIVINQ